jgi:hypothetical protein
VEKVKPLILSRRETEIMPTADNVWGLQEAVIAYGVSAHENGPTCAHEK